ncbi:MAG: NERD domain-containing protein [Chitinophagaceae bacterium]|nr:NERD domain-containing protein [Chitinophagaceae bacterium]
MSKTYNTIGCLSTIKSKLAENDIHDFKSVKELLDFRDAYSLTRQHIITLHEQHIENEKLILSADLKQLDIDIEAHKQHTRKILTNEIEELTQREEDMSFSSSSHIFSKLLIRYKRWNYQKLIKRLMSNLEHKVSNSTEELVALHNAKKVRYQFIQSHFKESVMHSAQQEIATLDRKKRVIDGLNSFIYGAIGEQQVVKTLEALSDDYHIINDFFFIFDKPIYYKEEGSYITSIQIDHLLVAPSGVFLIETKNWNEKSLRNTDLRSPVKQIKRSSFALFTLLHNENSNIQGNLSYHSWGHKKIPIKNLLVFTNSVPKEQFQFVKILALHQLISYVNYFKPIFSSIETMRIADYLASKNSRRMHY